MNIHIGKYSGESKDILMNIQLSNFLFYDENIEVNIAVIFFLIEMVARVA